MFDRDSKRGKRSGKLYSENGKKRYDQRLLTREARIRLTRSKTFFVISLGSKFCFLWFGSKKQGERLGCWKSMTKSRLFGAHCSKDGGFTSLFCYKGYGSQLYYHTWSWHCPFVYPASKTSTTTWWYMKGGTSYFNQNMAS